MSAFSRRNILLLALAVAAGSLRADQAVWSTGTGTAHLAWFEGVAAAIGFEALADGTTNAPRAPALTDRSAIKFLAPWGSPDSFLGGSLRFEGALTVRVGTATATIQPFDLFALKDTDTFEWRDEDSNPVLILDHFDVRFDPGMRTLDLERGTIRLAPDFAELAGHPDYAELVLGVFDARIDVRELAARVQRRPRPLPPACNAPAGTNAALRLAAMDRPQCIATNPLRFALPLQLANDGPDALPFGSVSGIFARVEARCPGSTGGTVTVDVALPLRVDPPERCPCPNLAVFPPHMTSLVTVADSALSGGIALPTNAVPGWLELTVRLGTDEVSGRYHIDGAGAFPRVRPASP